MTPETIRLVRTSFAQIAPVSDVTASLFYDRLFALDPSIRRLFPEDLGKQKQALMATLKLSVDHLDRPDELAPLVEQLGARHARYGVQPAHYPLVGSALLWTLEQALGPALSSAFREAWVAVYEVLAATMQAAAEHAHPFSHPESPGGLHRARAQ
jgi:hemoglobin-like flavoprotein